MASLKDLPITTRSLAAADYDDITVHRSSPSAVDEVREILRPSPN